MLPTKGSITPGKYGSLLQGSEAPPVTGHVSEPRVCVSAGSLSTQSLCLPPLQNCTLCPTHGSPWRVHLLCVSLRCLLTRGLRISLCNTLHLPIVTEFPF